MRNFREKDPSMKALSDLSVAESVDIVFTFGEPFIAI